MEEVSLIGKSVPRVDALEKVTGRAKYSVDIDLPGMLYGKVLRSKYPHARILSIDTSEAEKLAGLRAIVTAEDTPKQKIKVSGWGTSDWYALAADKVRYAGQEIAAVAAEDELTAEEALGLIKVEYEELPAVFDAEEAMKPGAPKVHDVENNIVSEMDTEYGNVARGFEEADYIFEDRFSTRYVHPCHMEPMVCIASYDSSGNLTFYENSVDPFARLRHAAKALGIPASKVKIVQKFIGGNFGADQCLLAPYIITALLAKKTGRPVKLMNTREEELIATHSRTPIVTYVKAGVKKDGTLTAREIRVIATAGAYCSYVPTTMVHGLAICTGLYTCPNVRLAGKCVYTNTVPSGTYRSFAGCQPYFAVESLMDMIAEKLTMDPIELRLKNATKTGDTTVVGQKVGSCGLQECMEKVADYAGWKEKRTKKQPNRGIGIACAMFNSDGRTTLFGGSIAYIKVLEDGVVRIFSGEYEWGQGSHTILSQIAAEELSVPLENVEFAPLDTDILPYTLGPYGGGRVTVSAGHAMRLAAIDARKQLFTVAAKMLGAGLEDLGIKDQKIFVRGVPEKAVTIAHVASYARYTGAEVMGKGVWDPDTVLLDYKTAYGNISSAWPFAAQLAEVEVDPETGRVTLLDFADAIDIGKAINPMAVEGQSDGGAAQEIGTALMEEILYEEGTVMNPNFMDYKVPRATNLPSMKTFLVETNDPRGPYGAKACGMITIMPTAAALANAIYNAVGVRIKDLPITPVKILKALEEKREEK